MGYGCFCVLASTSLFSPQKAYADYEKKYIGKMQTHIAVYEDTLVHLARKYGMGFVEVRAANPELDKFSFGA